MSGVIIAWPGPKDRRNEMFYAYDEDIGVGMYKTIDFVPRPRYGGARAYCVDNRVTAHGFQERGWKLYDGLIFEMFPEDMTMEQANDPELWAKARAFVDEHAPVVQQEAPVATESAAKKPVTRRRGKTTAKK